MPPTLDEIRRKGFQVLRRHLGRAGMIRFLQHFRAGHGDYAKERHAWVDGLSLEELRHLSGKRARPKKRRKRPPGEKG
jgi:hypothetical protein